jgi:glyoxylase-like metal-dependent hydrolase (beta-lactamase superfamily II)
LPVGALQCNCSIFGDEQTREAIVIDPGDEIEQIQQILDRHQLRVKAIVITHAHIDHIGGAAKLKKLTGAPVYMNENDVELRDQLDVQAGWLGIAPPEKPEIDAPLRDGDQLDLNGQPFQVLHTPGHTQGSVSLHLPNENKLIAGDTLFRDSIGRTDLPGGNGRQILVSIREKLLALDDEVVVIPGHGPETTIGREREHNYFLRGL